MMIGKVGAGVRAALAVAMVTTFLVAPGNRPKQRVVAAALVVVSPAILTEFLGRFPVAQILSLPLAWLLLDRAVRHQWKWWSDGILLALLWLVHAPTTVMVCALSAAAVVLGNHADDEALDRDLRSRVSTVTKTAGMIVLTWLAAAGLTVWHWWPLVASSAALPMRDALTGGEHHPVRNALGVSDPHLLEINVAMGWAAVGLLAALTICHAWRTGHGRLAILAVVMASWIALPLSFVASPLVWLQFPWRWMTPAVLLAAPVVAGEATRWGSGRGGAAIAALLLPILAVPSPQWVEDPNLRADTEPSVAGEAIAESFLGNPLLVDVREHRPRWWKDLPLSMALLGPELAVSVPSEGPVAIREWRPLRRRLVVDVKQPTAVVLRLMADDHWVAVVNGVPAEVKLWGAAAAISVPPGRNVIDVRWQKDWRAGVGVAIAVAVMTVVAFTWRRRRSGAADGNP